MRVLLLQSSPYLPSLGGANKANRLLLEALAARGHACRAVGPAGEGCAEARVLAGVEVRPVTDPSRLRGAAADEIAAFQPDRVLVSSEDPAQVLLEVAVEVAAEKVIYIAHTSLSLPFGPYAFLPSQGRAALLRRASAVVTVSRALQEYIRRWGGVESTVLRFPSYGPGPFPRLGRWDAGAVTLINPCAVKGIAIFLELARRFPEVPFAAVPTWGTTAADREALAALPNVRLLDPDPDVDRIFAQTRVLLVPSLWGEAFGQVVVEAMLRGIPVLASDVGGLPEAKLEIPYLLPVRPIERYRESLDDRRIPVAEVPEQDVEPWAGALAELLAGRGRYEELAERGRRAAHDFVAGARVEPFEELLAAPARMRILLIQPLAWLFAPGGAHKTNRLVMEGLAARGHECRVVAGSTDAGGEAWDLATRLREQGIPVIESRGPVTVFRHHGVTVHAVTGGLELGQEAVRQIRGFAPDRVMVSEDRTYVLLKAALEEAPGRVVVFAHSPATLPFGPDSFCADPHNAALLGRAAGILTVSRFMRDYIRRWAGLDSTVVYSPAYPPGAHPLLGRFHAGAVTLVNPSPIKGLAIFLELARRFPEIPFAAVPTWSTGAAERRLLESLPNVEIWEPVDDLAALFCRVRVLLAPSLWGEAFGQIVVEAMLYGVPVLASDSGGLPEAKLGLPYVLPVARIERWEDRVDDRLVPVPVVPEQDAGPWERALAELLGDRERYEDLAAASHRAAAGFVAGLDVVAYERFLAGLAPAPAVSSPEPAGAASPALKDRLAGLSPEKLELLARRLRHREAAPASQPAIPHLPRRPDGGGTFPLSFSQQRIWFLERFEPGSALYNEYFAARLSGPLGVAALTRSLAAIVARHEVLRTTFGEERGEPVQEVGPAGPVPLPLVDLAALPAGLREEEARRLAAAEGRRPFDLERGPVLRAVLLRLDTLEHLLMLAVHHIAADHWSIAVMVAELAAQYRGWRVGRPFAPPPLPVQYADFAAWQRGWLQGERLAALQAFWRAQLAEAPPLIDLPADRPRPATPSHRGAGAWLNLPPGLSEDLKALARREDATLFMLLLAAFQVLLGRLAGQEDLVLGSPVAGRHRVEVEGLIGVFLNVLPMRGRPRADLTFRGFLGETRTAALAAYAHQELPFEELVRDLAPDRSLGHNPVFQVLLNLQNTPAHALDLDGLALQPVPVSVGKTKLDLDLYLEEWEQALTGYLLYATDLFDAATAVRLLDRFAALLADLAARPEARLDELALWSPAEAQQVLREWNDTAVPEAAGLLHELFAAQAVRSPGAVAVSCKATALTYGELAARAGRLARWLRALGGSSEVRVGVLLDRTEDLPVALLGILAAGCAYVPLDPAYPAERLAFMLEDSGASWVVTHGGLAGRLPAGNRARVLLLEEAPADAPPAPAPAVAPESLAYVIYTSGSTGRPKGVAIEHRSAAALVGWAAGFFSSEELAGVLAATSVCFDLSVFEIFVPLSLGGRVVMVDNALALPGAAEAGVTLVNTVPSAMAELARAGDLPPTLRTVNLAGEPLPGSLARRLHAAGIGRVLNLYGPSEDTTYSTFHTVPAGAAAEPAIGRPVAGSRAHVLDRGLRPLPLGVPGELCLGGAGLARGYLGRPELTAERFVPDPLGPPGSRLYRTGDLVRARPDGELEFLGRLDHQVKLRGFRIELGEIEAALIALPGVEQAAVLVRDDAPGGRGLVAFVAGEATTKALKEGLRRRLPEPMVPGVFVRLPVLPLSPNGKVDRRALAVLRQAPAPAVPAGPRTAMEEILAGIWAEVLGGREPGPEDSFFDLGGHSLLATQVVSRVREVLGVELPLKALFEAPTLAALAARAEASRREGPGTAAPPVEPVDRGGELPLSFAQQRLWFLCQLRPESPFYNVPAAFRASGELSAPALESALRELLRRHEVLRTGFRAVAGRPAQEILPEVPLPLARIDLTALPGTLREAEAARLIRQEAGAPFDLGRPPLLRLRLLDLEPGERAMLATLHHIASDGWSMGVLVREIAALYAAELAGTPSPLPPLPVQYADFAAWQRRWLSGAVLEGEVAYWRGRLAGAPPLLDLPADRPRPPVASGRGGIHAFTLPSGPLAAFCRARGATLFMGLCAAFAALLAWTGGEEDLVIGAPIANRNRAETEGLIGFFVNTLALRIDVAGDPEGEELLRRVREVALDGYAHQDLPFDKLIEELAPRRDLAWAPLVQVSLTLQNVPAWDLAIPRLSLSPLPALTDTAKLDLSLIFEEGPESLAGAVEYNRDLFDEATVARLAGHLEALAEGLASRPGERLRDLPPLRSGEGAQLVRTGRRLRVRGLPLDPERMEALLLAQQGVREAVVGTRAGSGGEVLVAWVAGDGIEPAELRGALAAAIPASTMPDAIMVLPALPRAAGSADLAALPDPPPREPGGAPSSEIERAIAEVWQEVLGLTEIGIHDNFFDLGGHSLQVVEMSHRLSGWLGREIPMLAHFQFTTISSLAHYLEAGTGEMDAFDQQARAEIRRAAVGRQRQLRQRARAR